MKYNNIYYDFGYYTKTRNGAVSWMIHFYYEFHVLFTNVFAINSAKIYSFVGAEDTPKKPTSGKYASFGNSEGCIHVGACSVVRKKAICRILYK